MYLPLVDKLEHLLFLGQTVGVTGDGPYEARALAKIVTLEGGLVGDENTWQRYQLVIIGRENFDRKYLRESIRMRLKHEIPCEYISQEDFWKAWLDRQHYLPYVKGDHRIEEHPGLKFLSSIGFKWPILSGNEGASRNTHTSGLGCVRKVL
jgi:hypothetical protein